MKVVLYMAVSADGFIAGVHDETPWSDDEWTAFQEFVKTCDVVLLGRKTYEIMKKDGQFVSGPEYIVVTNDPAVDTGKWRKLSIQNREDMPQAGKVGVIGGGELNGSLIELGVVDEVILDIEPMTLGNGHNLLGGHSVEFHLELLSSRRIGGSTIQNHFRVVDKEKADGR